MTLNKQVAKSKKERIFERTEKIIVIRKQGKTQAETAKILGIKRSIVADTERNKFNIWGE